MFWRFNNMCTTNIDNLLNEEDITLQRLMDEDDIIQECKSSNRKLINFLVKPEVLHQLINLVTVEPSAQSPDATRFKYNNIASELFSCDVPIINDALVSDEAFLKELCDFIYGEPPLNPLMASFFSKTMAVLIGRKTDKMLEYLKGKEDFLPRLLTHLRTSAVMDFVLKLVTCVENKSSRIEIAQWLVAEHFVESLVALLSSGSEPDLHGNVAQLLCDLLRLLRDMHAQNVANEMNMSGTEEKDSGEPADLTDPILSALESKAMIDKLLDHILTGELGESSIVHGVTVLLTLLEIRRPPQLMNSEPEVFDRTPPDPVVTPCIRNTVEALIPRLKDLHNVLLHPPNKSGAEGPPEGACRHPLGFVRSQVTRLIAALVATGSAEVQKELASLGTLTVLLDMVVEFSHNNFLHAQVDRSIQHVMGLAPVELLRPPTEPKEGEEPSEAEPSNPSHPLLAHLMTEACLVRRIMEAWKLNEDEQNQAKGMRKAYMGHLIRIANYVVDFGKQGKNAAKIQQLLLDLPEDLRTQWQDFVDTKLAQANRNNEIIPVTSTMVAPRASSDEEDSDVIRHTLPRDTAAQEAFAAYQMEVMTKKVVSQFGLVQEDDDQLRPSPDTLINISVPDDTDELTHQSDLFEQACSERMVIRRTAGDGGIGVGDEDEDDDDETWLQRGRTRDSLNAPTNRPGSSSDEDGAEDANDSMDIDSGDPWAASTLDAVPVAVDSGNPWESPAPAASSSGDQEGEDNWANFAKFDSMATTATATPMEVSDAVPSPAAMEDMSPPAEAKETESAPEGSDPGSPSNEQNGPV